MKPKALLAVMISQVYELGCGPQEFKGGPETNKASAV